MTELINRLIQIRVIRYILTGGIATAVHIAVAFTVLRFIADHVFLANVCGFTLAFIFSYLMQTLFVFRHQLKVKNALRFFSVQFGALLASQLISELFSDTNSYLRVLMVVVILPVITYIIHKLWTFSHN